MNCLQCHAPMVIEKLFPESENIHAETCLSCPRCGTKISEIMVDGRPVTAEAFEGMQDGRGQYKVTLDYPGKCSACGGIYFKHKPGCEPLVGFGPHARAYIEPSGS